MDVRYVGRKELLCMSRIMGAQKDIHSRGDIITRRGKHIVLMTQGTRSRNETEHDCRRSELEGHSIIEREFSETRTIEWSESGVAFHVVYPFVRIDSS